MNTVNTDKIILFEDKKDCCACGACVNICPKQAISMQEDENGFLYPVINDEKCIKCGKCKTVCAYQNVTEPAQPKETYAAQADDEKLLSLTASGGIFSAIALKVLENNGAVFGCSMENTSDGLQAKHIKVKSKEELKRLQGSKYVQSITGDIYSQVKKELQTSRPVLFSGTPCQVAALKSYLGNKIYNNLYTIDIICHGVPGSGLFNAYIQDFEKKLNGTITEFRFRDKIKGWGYTGNVKYIIKDGKERTKLVPCKLSSYYILFLKSHIFRQNCYSCKYASPNRSGDITIGDYWGIENEHPEYLKSNGGDLDSDKGISCIIVNNECGKRMLDLFGDNLKLKSSEFEKAAKLNAQLKAPCKMSDLRGEIFNLYKDGGYQAVDSWYYKQIGYKKYVYKLFYSLPLGLQKVLKKLK